MQAEVIAVGDELTSGQRLDTNSQWLSVALGDCGGTVAYHSTVGDTLSTMTEVFRIAAARADVVVITGGLGPTADDLTREALANVANVALELDAASLRRIEAMFRLRGRSMPESNRLQAMFPAGSTPIENPHGTAPGISLRLPRSGGRVCHVFALPGVPAEMREMWSASVEPAIREAAPESFRVVHRRIKCFGTGESHLEAMLPDLIRRDREPRVGITVSEATITLRITARGQNEAACRAAIAPTERTIREALGDYVFGEEDDELHHVVARLLDERGLNVATVEQGTGGLLSSWLADCPQRVLQSGTVKHEGDDCGSIAALLATTAAKVAMLVAAPARASASDRVRVEIATPDRTIQRDFAFAAHPAIRKPLAVKQALNLLRVELSAMRSSD